MRKLPPISHRVIYICIFTYHIGNQIWIRPFVNLIIRFASEQSSTILLNLDDTFCSPRCSTRGYSPYWERRDLFMIFFTQTQLTKHGYHRCEVVATLSPSLLSVPIESFSACGLLFDVVCSSAECQRTSGRRRRQWFGSSQRLGGRDYTDLVALWNTIHYELFGLTISYTHPLVVYVPPRHFVSPFKAHRRSEA